MVLTIKIDFLEGYSWVQKFRTGANYGIEISQHCDKRVKFKSLEF